MWWTRTIFHPFLYLYFFVFTDLCIWCISNIFFIILLEEPRARKSVHVFGNDGFYLREDFKKNVKPFFSYISAHYKDNNIHFNGSIRLVKLFKILFLCHYPHNNDLEAANRAETNGGVVADNALLLLCQSYWAVADHTATLEIIKRNYLTKGIHSWKGLHYNLLDTLHDELEGPGQTVRKFSSTVAHQESLAFQHIINECLPVFASVCQCLPVMAKLKSRGWCELQFTRKIHQTKPDRPVFKF